MSDFNSYLSNTVKALSEFSQPVLSRFRDELRQVSARNGTLWVAGNGGSAATASHFVADMGKTAKGFTGRSVRTIAIHELQSLQTAYANDLSFQDAMSETLREFFVAGDALLILSVSGRSPNLLAAQRAGEELGLTTLCIVGKMGRKLAKDCDAAIVVNSDDYQVVENAHVVLMHWIARTL